jgi:membrane protein required for beta-lactamase induction
MIDKNYFVRQLEQYLDNHREDAMLSKVKLRYTMKKLGVDQYQVIDTKDNQVLWASKQYYGEPIWYCVMTAEEAEDLIEEQLENESCE